MVKAYQQGFTLIEQLVTLALSALLMAGIATSVAAITQAQNLTRDYGNLQETLSFVNSSLARSVRVAEKVKSKTNNKLLSIEIKNPEAADINCLAKEMTQGYSENYLIINNNLVCEVELIKGGSLIKESEVIAFGVSDLSFDCAEYLKAREVVFEECGKNALNNIIAVRVNLTLDRKYFLEIKKDFKYSGTFYFRLKHNDLISGL